MKLHTSISKITKWISCIILFLAISPLSFAQVFNGTTGAIANINCPMPDVFTAIVGTPDLILDEITIDISHTFDGDLLIFLQSPTGEILELSRRNGAAGDNYTNTVFTDDAPTFITSGTAPFTGSFKPEGSTVTIECDLIGNVGDFTIESQFGTVASDGTWELHVMDAANADVGVLNSWSLTFVPLPLNDVEAVSITHVLNDACFGNTETVEVVVLNKGDNDILAGDLTIELIGAENSPITMLNSTVITTFGLETITFSNVDLSVVEKLYSLTGTATLPGDTNPNNDATSTLTFNACGGSNFTFTVINTNDDGSGSLREAMTASNFVACVDVIEFDIPGGGPHTITLASDLPTISETVTIDGSSQPGFAGTPEIVIQATLRAFLVVNAPGTVIQFIAQHSGANHAIEIDQSDNVVIEGCHIGNDATGNTIGLGFAGIGILSSDSENLIIKDNVITETVLGVLLITGCHGAVLEGNHIGISASGTIEMENVLDGVRIEDSDNLFIGGDNPDQRNLISGNFDNGIDIDNCNSLSVINNFLGTDITGTVAIANTEGLVLDNSTNVTIKNNLMSGNSFNGMRLNLINTGTITGNLVGVDISGLLPLGNGDDGLLGGDLTGFTIGGPDLADRNIFSGNLNDGMTLFDSPSIIIENNIFGLGINGDLVIPNTFDGFDVINCDNSIIRNNVASGNLDCGFSLESDNTVVEGNKIGTDITGTIAKGNGDHGLLITGGQNTIGGIIASQRNIISANGDNGIILDNSDPGNEVVGNFIGLDVTGTVQMNNVLQGILIEDCSNNTIGSIDPAGRNVITSATDGIRIIFDESVNNLVINNFIGTDLTGIVSLPVGLNGVSLLNDANNNQIGQPDAGNVIASTLNHGIFFDNEADFNTIQSNFIGTDTSGTLDLGHTKIGILIEGASNNIIGGSNAGEGNLIMNNGEEGVEIRNLAFNPADANSIIGNTIQNNGFEGVEVSGDNNIVLSNEISNNAGAGIFLDFANFSTIGQANAGNTITSNGDEGIFLNNSEDNLVQGNFIGTDITGTQVLGNTFEGIYLEESIFNLIGGSNPGEGNIIANNGNDGIEVSTDADNNTVLSNEISNNAGEGIFLFFANLCTIGQANAGNTITDNGIEGITLLGSDDNTVRGNFIGTDVTGTQVSGNALNGIYLEESILNFIGGSNPGDGNIIANNGQNGIIFFEDVLPNNKNEILANSIFDNALLGIDLGDDGITPNDFQDGDTGCNDLQNFPIVTSAVLASGSVTIIGTLNSIINTTYRLDFYNSIGTNAAGNVEGQEFLGSQNVTTDGNGDAAFNVNFATTIASVDFVSTTATDPEGNTSEFSEALFVLPVELLSFTARPLKKRIRLEWTTVSEINNSGFEIERSSDGIDFKKITWQSGFGNSQNEIRYIFDDKSVSRNQIYYYRLRQIDLDGKFEFSNIVEAKILGEASIKISPNPTSDEINVTVSDDFKNESLSFEIYNILGRQVFYKTIDLKNEPSFQFSFLSVNLTKGIYFLHMKHLNQEVVSKKLIFN